MLVIVVGLTAAPIVEAMMDHIVGHVVVEVDRHQLQGHQAPDGGEELSPE